jgi:transcriptional regulator with XRE-family HTH domain
MRPLGPDSPFPDNVRRLFGLHALSGSEAAKLLGISQSTIVKWAQGTRAPSFKTALIVGDFFQISADRLATAEFSDLLANELANPERFRTVEQRISRARARLEREAGRKKKR